MTEPSWRTGAGIALILAMIGAWTVLVVSLSTTVERWPALGQALFYLVTGIIWVVPLKPLLRWMETGHFRP